MTRSTRRIAAALLLLLLASGCSELRYYAQAIDGHFTLMRAREPVQQLLDATDTSAELRRRLLLSREILRFAHANLQLPDNGSYQSYIQSQRPYVVWNVYAAPELSLDAVEWCVPLVVGCTIYRGWFDPEHANRHADKLRSQGDDAFVGGVTAYSTLGWFADPLLSTFFEHDDWRSAALLFHELAHQQLYVAGDTRFNESFAVTVEREGTRRWLQQHGGAQAIKMARQHWQRQDQRAALFAAARRQLNALYQGNASDEEKRHAKNLLLTRLAEDSHWQDAAGQAPNNATLAAFGAYTTLVPAFERLLLKHGGALTDFYQAADQLAGLPQEQRRQALLLSSNKNGLD